MKKLGNHNIDRSEEVITIKGLHKSFGDLQVLRGVEMHLFKGENIAILGRSGTGKSVLIKIIIGLLKPDAGDVLVFGQKVDQLDSEELDKLRLRIGFSFQNAALYDSMNIYNNLAFPLRMNKRGISKKEINLEVDEVLEAVGLIDKKKQMPSDLSGGQKKRIGIARTLILKPEIMLYDEPTSGLDPITSGEIIELINNVQQRYNTSSIIITHDLVCAKNTSDRLTMLVDGKFTRPALFDDVFSSDAKHITDFYNYNFIH